MQQKDRHYICGPLQLIKKMTVDSTIMCCKFNQECSVLSVGLTSGKIQVINVKSNYKNFKLVDEDIINNNSPCTCIRYIYNSNNSLLIASYSVGMIKFWNYNDNICIKTINESRSTLSMAMHPTCDRFLTVGNNTDIFMYNVETGENIFHLCQGYDKNVLTGHSMSVFSAIYHSENEFLTGGWDNIVLFWDDRKKQSIRYIYGPHICGEGIDIHPDTNLIVTASWQKENPIQIWDYDSGRLVQNISQGKEKSFYYGGEWISNDHIICNGTNQNVFKLYSIDDPKEIAKVINLPHSVNCSDAGLNSELKIIAFCSGNIIYFIKLKF